MRNRTFLLFSVVLASALFLSACETTPLKPAAHVALPRYEPPIAKATLQHIRTTAYTHSEADHLPYGRQNALGGKLRAAVGKVRRAEVAPLAQPIAALIPSHDSSVRISLRPAFLTGDLTFARVTLTKATKTVKRAKATKKKTTAPQIGSAAADWARWPMGTTFRLRSTGQTYRVDDYGWALAGRNTIDLYMPTRSAMNSWGARDETIEILHWGNPDDSLRLLQGHQSYRHIHRMVLELEGDYAGAAAME